MDILFEFAGIDFVSCILPSPLFSNFSAVIELTHAGNPLFRITKLRPALQVTSFASIPLSVCFLGDSAFAGFANNEKDKTKNKTIPNNALSFKPKFIIL